VPAGFPPIPWYQLDDVVAVDEAQVSRSVSFRRRDHVCKDLGRLSRVWRVDAHAAQLVWLIDCGGVQTRAACERDHALTTFCSSATALQRLVVREQDVVERDFAAMVRELQRQKRLLDGDAKTAQPNLRVDLHDRRGNPGRPLPEPESLLRPTRPRAPTALQ
jgi:hypothetical protein